jgi:phosphohistidine phosphatase
MKRLVIIRHAHAEHSNVTDFKRELTVAGGLEAIAAGKILLTAKIIPDMLISSPAQRAASTAIAIAKTVNFPPKAIVFEHNLYFGDYADTLSIIRQAPDKIDTLFIVGHNPTMIDVVNELSTDGIEHLPPAGMILLEWQCQSWQEIARDNASGPCRINP